MTGEKRGKLLHLACALLLAGTLGACASAPPNTMSIEQRQALAITEVEVRLAPDADIWWGEAERDFAASKGCGQSSGSAQNKNLEAASGSARKEGDCDYDAIINSSEGQAYLRQQVSDRLEQALVRIVQPAFQGSKKAKLVATPRQVYIVSTGQALIFGGQHVLTSDFEIFDLVTGRSLARYSELTETAGYGLGGVLAAALEAASNDPYDRLAADYAQSVKEWIQEEEG